MKRNLKKILIFTLVITIIFTLAGCASTDINSPEDAIKDAYGNTQYRVSFDSTTLESPLADIYYTANNMPILPIPKKVGFVFAGWFFDASLTEPCDVPSGDLYWKMEDLTLYPKWEKEKIVNNGTYEIEYTAKIVEGSVAKGPLARSYQKFPDDIIASETYIEKNDKGTFLRIQYDNVVRGPVLGSAGSDESNFSKMTYTIKDKDNRINKDISIQDRTSNIQTIYYDITGKGLTDTITLNVEYYNWKIDVNDEDRYKYSVVYEIEFKIDRFIGFDQSFVNPEAKLEDGAYVIPTHYTSLDKQQSMLDMFNPVYAYILASDGRYTLYKPLNTYNNDIPNITPTDFPLRTSGYAREFTCMYIDKNKKISKSVEENMSGEVYLPEIIGAKKYIPLTYEFHADTGRYYYAIELGKTLDNDLVFIGGSAGAMEQMFSFPFSYRRLSLDYNSMVHIAGWDYKPLSGNEYTFREDAVMYPGATADFKGVNTDYDIYKQYKKAINMTNVFFTKTSGNKKVYDTKMTIAPYRESDYPCNNRYKMARFELSYSAYGYDPIKDGNLLARDLTFTTDDALHFSNSAINTKYIGKTFNLGEKVSLSNVFKEKVYSDSVPFTYKAYKVKDNLEVDFTSEVDIANSFILNENIAVLFNSTKKDKTILSSLVYLMVKQEPTIQIIDNNTNWHLDNGIYVTDKRFLMGENGDIIQCPEVRYNSYGINMTTRGLRKYDEDDVTYTDFTLVSIWDYNYGKYTSKMFITGNDIDFAMESEKVRVMMQLVTPFGDFSTIEFEYRGVESGEYKIKYNDKIVNSGDIKYKGEVRTKINYENPINIVLNNEGDISKIADKYSLVLSENSSDSVEDLLFDSASIYLQNTTVQVNNKNDIWNVIKGEPYALLHIYYTNKYGDMVIDKAEFNFKLDGKNIADNTYFINDSKTTFTHSGYEFRKPVMMDDACNIIDTGRLTILKKNGYNWDNVDEKDANFYGGYYSNTINFYRTGTYLLKMSYELYKSNNGKYVFEYNVASDYAGVLTINICQVVEVVDKNTDMTITFVTDHNHPILDSMKEELVNQGFIITEDSKYQYMTITTQKDVKSYAPNYKYFDIPAGEKLFVWSLDGVDETLRPGYMIRSDLAVKHGTVNMTLYAWWDKGIDVAVSYDIYGEVKQVPLKPGDNRFERNPDTGGGYNIFFSTLAAKVKPYIPKGYVIYGWIASEAIFSKPVFIEGVGTQYRPSNFHKGGAEGNVYVYKKIDFTAVLKKEVGIGYEAVDESGASLEFMKPVRDEYNIYMNDKFNDVLSNAKLKELANVSAENKTFKCWNVYDYELKQYVEVDLKTFVLEKQYINESGKIILRAVFKNKA